MEEAGREQVKYMQFSRKGQKSLHQSLLTLYPHSQLKALLWRTALVKDVGSLLVT